MRRLTSTEGRPIGNLILQVESGALLGPLDEQNRVFKYRYPRPTTRNLRAFG